MVFIILIAMVIVIGLMISHKESNSEAETVIPYVPDDNDMYFYARHAEVIEAFVKAINARQPNSPYSFFKNGKVTFWRYTGPYGTKITLYTESGKEVEGIVTFKEEKVDSFKSLDGIYELWGEKPQELKFSAIKNDVTDMVNNDLVKYINKMAPTAMMNHGVRFNVAEGLGIPYEEYLEKYDTKKYQKAWDKVLKSTFKSIGFSCEKDRPGVYIMELMEESL